jgi:pimeloyl-ACP methyl ester carboxylesterase
VASTPEALADAVESTMDEHGFQTAHLVGNSLGGWIALELARRGRARTCVALSPDLLRSQVGRTLFSGPMLGRPWRADSADHVEQTALLTAAPGFDPTLSETLDRQVAGLPEIRCPVLVLWGTKDVVLIPRQGRRFDRLIPTCELRYLKGLGHVPMSDDPELLVNAITDFALAQPPPD